MRRLAIFAHFDAQREVKRFVIHHLRALRQVVQRVVFVSNSPLGPESTPQLEGLCDAVFTRANTGYDFAMWQHGLAQSAVGDFDEIVLTNSSVFGPIFPLEEAFAGMQDVNADFWGMTENSEFARHVQSYFLVFRRKALDSSAFAEFFASVLPYRDKYQTIRSYELGLTAYLQEQGLRAASLIPGNFAKPRWPHKKLYDFTLSRPLELLEARMPYVKVGLLRDNPKGVALGPVYEALASAGYDRSLIEFDRKEGAFHVGES